MSSRLDGKQAATNQFCYIVADEGGEHWTVNSVVARKLQTEGYLVIGHVALPVVTTQPMIDAGMDALAKIGAPQLTNVELKTALLAALRVLAL